MSDLNTMLREHAVAGLQAELDVAVTNGDTEAARKAADKIAKFEVQLAPKPSTTYGNAEITAELEKAPWYGTDPKKSGRIAELGKFMDPKKFPTAAAFAAALIKAVDDEFAPAGKAATDDEPGDDDDPGDDDAGKKKDPPARRQTDGPGDLDASRSTRKASGPWTKLSDAPADVQKEINRTADKFAGKTKEAREKFVANALGAHYNRHQLSKGKK